MNLFPSQGIKPHQDTINPLNPVPGDPNMFNLYKTASLNKMMRKNPGVMYSKM